MSHAEKAATENWRANSRKCQGHWTQESANQSYHVCITLCPQLTTMKITAKQTTNILTGYVWMICLLHMLPPKRKRKNQVSSFPHKAQDKINPIYIFEAKMSVFLASVCFFCYHIYRLETQAHYPWQKIPLLYKIKLLILTFILIQFAE